MESYLLSMPKIAPLKIDCFVLFQAILDSFYLFAYFHIMVVLNTYLINFNCLFFNFNLNSNYLISYLLNCAIVACERLILKIKDIENIVVIGKDFGKKLGHTGIRMLGQVDGSQSCKELHWVGSLRSSHLSREQA
jgi:hypothetical protein